MMLFPMQAFNLPILQSPLGMPHVLTVGAALFALGLFAVLAHRNFLRILMGLELMLLAAMLNLAAFTAYLRPEGLHGHAVTLLLVLVALAQLTIGLAVAAQLMRRPETQASLSPEAPAVEKDPLDVERYDDLKW
jgi:NADH:ubiquinone oxidoreductase subunit K